MGTSWITVGGASWPAMPIVISGSSGPPGWHEFQTNAPPPKLVDVVADWITAGKVNDVPSGVMSTMPQPISGGLDPGVSLFVCSVPGDDGTRPGTVSSNFWASSLIFFVDPRTGTTVNPPELAASSEYYLTAVIGNRGDTDGGCLNNPPGSKIEAAGWVMVWNTGMSPAVQLPSLSNLDVNSKNGIYEVYFLWQGRYDVVGFWLNVQTVFDGLVKAIHESGMDLGGLTPQEWVHAQGAHLCAKVLVRQETESWPSLGDTPLTNRRLAQKNLAPFAIDLSVSSPDPNIIWKNFVVGDVIRFWRQAGRFDERWGVHRLTIERKFRADALRLYLAIPKRSFARWFHKVPMKGFEVIDQKSLPGLKVPFPEHVILALRGAENTLEIPPLGDEYLAMSLGIEYSVKRLKPGRHGEIAVVQKTEAPKFDTKKGRYEIEQVTVGGFTIELQADDPREKEKELEAGTRRGKGVTGSGT